MTLLFIIIATIAALAVLVSRQPNEFRIARSIIIHAPASAIFPHVNNLIAWAAWSPWVKLDPAAHYTFDGPQEGLGASTRWEGKKAGAGRSTITESLKDELVRFRLDFERPMKATNMSDFTFVPQGTSTEVTWSMTGKNSLAGKCVGMVINCEKMLGTQFAQGLGDLKTLVEA